MNKYNLVRIWVWIPSTVRGSVCPREYANDFKAISLYLILGTTSPENDSEGRERPPRPAWVCRLFNPASWKHSFPLPIWLRPDISQVQVIHSRALFYQAGFEGCFWSRCDLSWDHLTPLPNWSYADFQLCEIISNLLLTDTSFLEEKKIFWYPESPRYTFYFMRPCGPRWKGANLL